MTNLPRAVRDELDPLWPFQVELEQSADGGTTRKWRFYHDGLLTLGANWA